MKIQTADVRWLVLAAAFAAPTIPGCGSGAPGAPPEMNIDDAKTSIERNAQMEIEHIESDTELSDEEKQKRIEQVRRGSEGQLKVYAEAKTARDEAYPPGQ